MALKASVLWRGLTIPAAFMRVTAVNGSKQAGWGGMIELYASQDAFDAGEKAMAAFSVYQPARAARHGMPGATHVEDIPKTTLEIDIVEKDMPDNLTADPFGAVYFKLHTLFPDAKKVD